MSRLILIVLALCTTLIDALDAVEGLPVPTSDKVTGELPKTSKKKARRPIQVPDNVDVSSLLLREVLDMRPRDLKSEHGARYKQYFARHPDIKAINLNDEDPQKVADAFVNLNLEGFDQPSKGRLTASIKDHIAEAHLDKEQNRNTILNLISGKNYENSLRNRHERFLQKAGPNYRSEQKIRVNDRSLKRTGMRYGMARARAKLVNPQMNLPLAHHLDGDGKKELSAVEAEEAIKKLSHLYSNEGQLTRKFSQYLMNKNTPPDQYNHAMALRAATVKAIGSHRRRAAKKRNADVPSTSTSASLTSISKRSRQAWTSAGFSAASDHDNRQSSQTFNSQHMQAVSIPPPTTHTEVSLDPNDDANWRWLTDYLDS